MSSSNPPYPYYPNIPYNPSFFNDTIQSGLSESVANTLYLRKKVSDTATALETFSAGVSTNSITNTSGNMTISPSTGASLNVGTTNTDIILNGKVQASNVNALLVNGVESDMTISNLDEFSSLSIGCYSERKGGVNIYTSSITPVDNKVIIGHSLVTPLIARNTTELNSSDILINNEIITDNTKTITIGRTSGLFDTNTTINGKTTITKLTAGTLNTNTITNTAGNMTISPTATTASLLIGNATTTTDIQIGTIDGRSNHIHIGDGNNNVAGGGVHINNGLNNLSNVNILNGAGSTGIVTIGTTGTTTNLNGTIAVLGTLTGYAKLATAQTFTATQSFTGTLYGIACSKIRGITGQTSLSLFDDIASSTITIGNASTITLDGTVKASTITSPSTITDIAIGGDLTSGNIKVGGVQTSGEIVLGKTKKVRQIFELSDGTTIEDVTGNTDSVGSYSRTFNHKVINSAGATAVYRIDTANQYSLQYFELNISGSNYGAGIFSYKYAFVITTFGAVLLTGLTTIYSYSQGVTSTFSSVVSGTSITLYFDTTFVPSAYGNQAYSTTLIAYPTVWNDGTEKDYSITAL